MTGLWEANLVLRSSAVLVQCIPVDDYIAPLASKQSHPNAPSNNVR